MNARLRAVDRTLGDLVVGHAIEHLGAIGTAAEPTVAVVIPAYDEAEAIAKRIQAQLPDNRDVKLLLEEITRARQRGGDKRPSELQRKLANMNVPEINFREANAQDVVTFLQEESAKLSPDKKAINFVWLVPDGTKVPAVSLSLKHIPMLDVLQYITQITGLRYRVDAHAVVIYKDAPAVAQSAPAAPAESNAKPE